MEARIMQPQRLLDGVSSRADKALQGECKLLDSKTEEHRSNQQAFAKQQSQKQARSRTSSWSPSRSDAEGHFFQVTPDGEIGPHGSNAAARRTLLPPLPYDNESADESNTVKANENNGTIAPTLATTTATKATASSATTATTTASSASASSAAATIGWFEKVPDHIWLVVLKQMDNASQAAFAAVCRRCYLVFRSGSKVFHGTLNGLTRLQGMPLPAMMDAAKAAWELHPGYNRLLLPVAATPTGRRWNAAAPTPWSMAQLKEELDRVQIGVRSVEIYSENRIGSTSSPYSGTSGGAGGGAAGAGGGGGGGNAAASRSWSAGSAAGSAGGVGTLGGSKSKRMLPEGGETLERVPLERACHRPSAPKGSCCITRLVVIAKAGWVQSPETLEQHIETFPALRDLCLVSMCVAKPQIPNDDENGGGAAAGAPVYGAAPASPGAVFRAASRRAEAAEAAEAKATAKAAAAAAAVAAADGGVGGGKKKKNDVGLRSLELVGSYAYRKMPEVHAVLAASPNLKMLVCKEVEFDQAQVLRLVETCPKLERVCLLDCNQDGFMANRGNARLSTQLEAMLPDCNAEVEEKISNLFDMLNFE